MLSKKEIDAAAIRSFRTFLWRDMPGARPPADPLDADGDLDTANWCEAAERDVLRLSAENHVDVPILVNGETTHLLASHPTPPVFDGPEDRNGLRDADEIRFWADYVNGAASIDDDAGAVERGRGRRGR